MGTRAAWSRVIDETFQPRVTVSRSSIMSFVRVVLPTRHPDSAVEDGIFGVAHRLCDDRTSVRPNERGSPTPAREHGSRMEVLKRILEAHRYPVIVVRETRVGHVVYEDEVQVVAEPLVCRNAQRVHARTANDEQRAAAIPSAAPAGRRRAMPALRASARRRSRRRPAPLPRRESAARLGNPRSRRNSTRSRQ
jgi:hypothetical protein